MLLALFKSGAAVTLLRGANTLLGFVVLMILTRVLGPEGLGAYAYAATLLLLLSIPVSYGWAPLLLRETARALHDDNWPSVKGIAQRGAKMSLWFTALGLLVGLSFASFRYGGNQGWVTPAVVLILCFILMFDQLSALRTSLLRGLGRAFTGQIPEMLVKPIAQLAMLTVGLVVFTHDLDLQSALTILAGATLLSYAAGALILHTSIPPALAEATPQFDDVLWRKSSTMFAGSSAIALINANADLLLLGLLRGTAEVGYYKVALQVSLAGALAYTSLNMIAVQRFATAHAARDISELQQTATYMARLALLPALVAFFIILLAGEKLVPLAFGTDFLPSIVPMIILSAAQTFNAGSGMGRSLLMVSGHENKVMYWAALGLSANVLLSVLLIPSLGATGAAIGHLVSLLLWNCGILWETRRTNDIDASAVGIKK